MIACRTAVMCNDRERGEGIVMLYYRVCAPLQAVGCSTDHMGSLLYKAVPARFRRCN